MTKGCFRTHPQDLSAVGASECAAINGDHVFLDAEAIDQELAGPAVGATDHNVGLSNQGPDGFKVLGRDRHGMNRHTGIGFFFENQVTYDVHFEAANLRGAAAMSNDISNGE